MRANKLPKRLAAFPNSVPNEFYDFQDGMELRDWFAGQALAGMLASPLRDMRDTYKHDYCAWAYGFADAMLNAREGK